MKRSHLLSSGVLFLMASLLIFSCDKKPVDLVELDSTDLDSALWDRKDSIRTDTSGIPNFDLLRRKGATWRAWMRLHRDCMSSEWLKKAYYMGVTSTINLGAIINSSDGLQRRLEDALSASEVSSVINFGAFATCGVTQSFSINVTALLQSDIHIADSTDVAAELTMKIQSSRKTDMKIEKWRVNNIVEGVLLSKLSGSDPQKTDFIADLQKDGFRMITKIIEIEGFKTILEFESEISPALEAKLKNGMLAKFANTSIEAKVNLINKKSIEMVSTSNFYVFAELKKGKKVGN